MQAKLINDLSRLIHVQKTCNNYYLIYVCGFLPGMFIAAQYGNAAVTNIRSMLAYSMQIYITMHSYCNIDLEQSIAIDSLQPNVGKLVVYSRVCLKRWQWIRVDVCGSRGWSPPVLSPALHSYKVSLASSPMMRIDFVARLCVCVCVYDTVND